MFTSVSEDVKVGTLAGKDVVGVEAGPLVGLSAFDRKDFNPTGETVDSYEEVGITPFGAREGTNCVDIEGFARAGEDGLLKARFFLLKRRTVNHATGFAGFNPIFGLLITGGPPITFFQFCVGAIEALVSTCGKCVVAFTKGWFSEGKWEGEA